MDNQIHELFHIADELDESIFIDDDGTLSIANEQGRTIEPLRTIDIQDFLTGVKTLITIVQEL